MFKDIIETIEAKFSGGSLNVKTDDNINVYPSNYQGEIQGNEWCRLNILPDTSAPKYGGQTITGLITVNIFVETGKGVRRAHEIADALNTLLFGVALDNNIQVTNSYITTLGQDPVNSSLYRIDWNGSFRN